MLQNMGQTQHSLPSLGLGVDEAGEEVVAGNGGQAEKEEVDCCEDVRGGEGATVRFEVCQQLHFWLL